MKKNKKRKNRASLAHRRARNRTKRSIYRRRVQTFQTLSEAAGINPQSRPQDLNIGAFCKLARGLG